jgi:hypothetical protein
MSGVPARTLLVAAVAVVALLGGLAVVAVPGGSATVDDQPEPSGTPGADGMQVDGVTGEGVRVAVLDPTGFDTDHPAYADSIADARSFGSGGTVGPNAADDHGTRSAREVASVAPDATLYLAEFDGEAGYGRAMAWAVRRDVDVVVVPAAFHGTSGGGQSLVANVTERAIARDVVRAWVSWEASRLGASYALELYRSTPDGPRLVARSVPYEGDRSPNARLNVRVEPGTHFLVVRGPDRPTGATVSVRSSTHALQHVTVRGSIVAPATAEGVIAVGAWNDRLGRLAAYSSSGPTLDGRRGLDVVAPAAASDGFRGTSVAAARAGGVAALLRAVHPNATPASVERYLEATARDVGPAGPDVRTGGGLLRPERAVAAALDDAGNATGTG